MILIWRMFGVILDHKSERENTMGRRVITPQILKSIFIWRQCPWYIFSLSYLSHSSDLCPNSFVWLEMSCSSFGCNATNYSSKNARRQIWSWTWTILLSFPLLTSIDLPESRFICCHTAGFAYGWIIQANPHRKAKNSVIIHQPLSYHKRNRVILNLAG